MKEMNDSDSREGREHGAKSLSHGGILANSALLARLSLDFRPLLPNDFRAFQFLSGAGVVVDSSVRVVLCSNPLTAPAPPPGPGRQSSPPTTLAHAA
jgi:hypothetical protein